MKKILSLLSLAALTIGLLGSCSKMNERIDSLDQRVGSIENEKIASIENQIAAINASIADLGAIRKDILDLQVAVGAKGEDISELRAADEALSKRIEALEAHAGDLSKYAEKDWVTATFATLEQLEATNTALGALEEKVNKLGETTDAKIAGLKTELTNAIDTAVSGINATISTLEDRVAALEAMIQTVTIIPAYNDGSVKAEEGILTINCVISPKEAVISLKKENFTVLTGEVITKAGLFGTLPVADLDIDKTEGSATIKVDASSAIPAEGGKALAVALNVKNGISDFTTEFVNVTKGSIIKKLREVGKVISTAKISAALPEGSQQTLESIRYVEGKPLYYMDYTAKVDWESLLTQPADEHFDFPCLKNYTDKVSMALFGTVPNGEVSNPGGSCSGFICHNSKGEMLHGRNYDGDVGEMVVVFNKNVKPGEHKSVMMTDLNVVQQLSGDMRYNYRDSALLKPNQELNALLRQPLFALDGMNDAGLVISCYQLPNFYTGTEEQRQQESGEFPYDDPNGARRPRPIKQESGKPQSGFMGLHNLALTKCTTVDEVIELFKSYDFVTLDAGINLHWCVADGNKWVTLEYWKDPRREYVDLNVLDEGERVKAARIGQHDIPYEYLSFENYYYSCYGPHLEPASTFSRDYWQHELGVPIRVHNMMNHYSLVMDEEEALNCLQYGHYGSGFPGQTTNWSCVYNPKQRTVIFTVRNETDRAFTIDLKEDLK